jgi:hypothetical protein
VTKISALEICNEIVNGLLQSDSAPLRLLDDPEVCLQLCQLLQCPKKTLILQ